MQIASAQVAQMVKFVSVAAGTHRMELGVNGGCSSDGLSGQSIDPAKVRKQWQAATRDVGRGFFRRKARKRMQVSC
jgi:hypothetical protein